MTILKYTVATALFCVTFGSSMSNAQGQTPSALDKAALETYLRYSELWIPQVAVRIDDPKPSSVLNGFFDVGVHLTYNGGTKDEQYFVSKDGRNIVKGTSYDITKSPFAEIIDQLKTDKQPAFGAAASNAAVTLAVFGDFQCPVCQKESQDLRKNLPTAFGDKVRVVFYDFPLTSIHPWAMKGSIAGRCMYQTSEKAFWDYHDWVYEKQKEITLENLETKITDFAKQNFLDSAKINACMADKATAAIVEKSLALGHDVQVAATPTLFINGRKIEGALDWNVLSQLLQIEIDHQALTNKKVASEVAKPKTAEDKCCVVEIPALKAAASKR